MSEEKRKFGVTHCLLCYAMHPTLVVGVFQEGVMVLLGFGFDT